MWVLDHPSSVGEARRGARELGREAGLREPDLGKVELVVAELGTNIVRHAGEGHLLARALKNDGAALEILALDRGPGMADPAACLRDGHSTAGSPGTGLGAVRRLACAFDFMSRPGDGTAVLARIGAPCTEALEVGAVCLPRRGEQACGDAWAVWADGRDWRALVADGLGHGSEAARASEEAVRVFREHGRDAPAALLQRMHQVLRSTRGAAALLLDADAAAGSLRACGVGNVSAAVVEAEALRQVSSVNGTLGHAVRRLTEFAYRWPRSSTVVVHSDGLSSQMTLGRYPGWMARHVSLLAGVLWRDFGKAHDDATVLVLRQREAMG
jgi:anti-sigma regulatory factor (Ser/Thr protein kinase)